MTSLGSSRADLRSTAFVLAVPDAAATADWWVEAAGFERVFETTGWVFVQRGACLLMLGSCPDALPPRDLGDHNYFAYVTVDSVDALYDEFEERNVEIIFPPTDRDWGKREMAMRTPDGHRIMFAQSLR